MRLTIITTTPLIEVDEFDRNRSARNQPGYGECSLASAGPEPSLPPEPKRECRSCRWWDMHSLDLKAGDCRVPGHHRYSRVLVTSQRPDGSEYRSYAMLDSFGPETTLPGFVCGAWDDGHRAERVAIAKALSASTASPAERPVLPGDDQ